MVNESFINFTLVYNKYKKPLFNYICKIMKSEIDSEDILHNVFIKLYDNINKIRDKERIEFWIFSTARNEIMDIFRKNRKSHFENIEEYSAVISSGNPYDEFDRKEIINYMEAELAAIDPSQAEIYYLKVYSGLSYREIAEIFEISEDLVRSRIFKVRQKLRNAVLKIERSQNEL